MSATTKQLSLAGLREPTSGRSYPLSVSSGSPLRVLILCESSGVVRNAFRALGHNAWSCDLLPADDGSPYHMQCDARDAILSRYDLIGMHPPCTYVNGAGLHWNNRGRGWEKTNESLAFIADLMRRATDNAAAWYLENPVGIISTKIRAASQYVQPYDFGEDASKKTGLWLYRLPLLHPTRFVPPRYVCCGVSFGYERGKYGCANCNGEHTAKPRWANQTDSGQNKLTPSADRWKARSKTYAGIACAMASQWSAFLANTYETQPTR